MLIQIKEQAWESCNTSYPETIPFLDRYIIINMKCLLIYICDIEYWVAMSGQVPENCMTSLHTNSIKAVYPHFFFTINIFHRHISLLTFLTAVLFTFSRGKFKDVKKEMNSFHKFSHILWELFWYTVMITALPWSGCWWICSKVGDFTPDGIPIHCKAICTHAFKHGAIYWSQYTHLYVFGQCEETGETKGNPCKPGTLNLWGINATHCSTMLLTKVSYKVLVRTQLIPTLWTFLYSIELYIHSHNTLLRTLN